MRSAGEDPETGEELEAPRVYEPVNDLHQLRLRLQTIVTRFNDVHKLYATDLVLFDDA